MVDIVVYDAMCGSGKTERVIGEIANKTNPVIYISPLLTELDRICGFSKDDQGEYIKDDDGNYIYDENHPLFDKQFVTPKRTWRNNKQESIKWMFEQGMNIAATHTLFTMLDDSCYEAIKRNKYEIIVDEELCVWKRFQIPELSKDGEDYDYAEFVESAKDRGMSATDKEVANLIANGVIEVDPIGMLHWQEDKYKLDFEGLLHSHIKRGCDAHQLYLVVNKTVYWEFSVDLIKTFSKVTILTYMFSGSYFAKYLDYYELPYRVEKFGKSPTSIKHLVNIVEGRINDVGERETALSYSDLSKSNEKGKELRKTLNKNLNNFFRNICKSAPEDRLWTTYKCSQTAIQGRHKVAWLAFSTKATNDYRECRDVAYLCNNYPNVNVNLLIKKRTNTIIDKDLWALSNMIQFVFRSRLRNDEPINLYVPSKRMRELFLKWLDGEFDE